MSNLKQGTLSFTSAKRSKPAATNGKSQKRTAATAKNKNRGEILIGAQSDTKPSDVFEISSEEDAITAAAIVVPAKRTRASTKKRASSRTTKQEPLQSEEQKVSPAKIERGRLDIEDKAGHYRRYYNEVRSKMGYIQPVHSESQNKIHQMLHFFDMTYEFGPCIGMTRLERWERAEAFGLNPPQEVRDILLTKEGIENDEYAECVLSGEV